MLPAAAGVPGCANLPPGVGLLRLPGGNRMAADEEQRKIAAILAADVAGYSRLMADDERATVRTLTDYRGVFAEHVESRQGRIVDTAGDSVLCVFESVVEAVEAAVAVQAALATRNAALADHRRMYFRIGVNLGDIIVNDDGSIYGDGVNVAARLEGLVEPGGIMLSDIARQAVEDKLDIALVDAGRHEVKNINKPVHAFRVAGDGAPPVRPARVRGKPVWLVAALAVAAIIVIATWQLMPAEEEGAEIDPAIPSAPGIAVLPFDNLSEDPDQEYFANGLTEDIITTLSRYEDLLVIARNSTFTYKGAAIDVREVGRALGVRYVMEGSVRKAENRVLISANLIDAEDGGHIWSERYDRELVDIFAFQDEISREIAEALRLELSDEEQGVSAKRPSNSEAYDLFLRGRAYKYQTTRAANALAREALNKAVALEPGFSEAYAELAWVLYRDWFYEWSDDPGTIDLALEAAQRAVALNDRSALAYSRLSWILVNKREYDGALEAARRAIELNARSSDALWTFALILIFVDRPEEAVTPALQAVRLDPEGYLPIHIAGVAYLLSRRYDDAVAAFKKSLLLNPNVPSSHWMLAATYSEMGHMEDARAEVREVLALQPEQTLALLRRRLTLQSQESLDRLLAALANAGFPQGEYN